VSAGNEVADRVLVIAYGNPLRGDDGIAWQAAENIERELPSVTVVCAHQLTPELAEAASAAGTVIFIDATLSAEPGKVVCKAVSAECGTPHYSHILAPAQILTLCNQLYGVEPQGFLISISGENFDHGEALSAAAINGVPRALAAIRELLRGIATHAAR
jgi:hydrogenase maturation protease